MFAIKFNEIKKLYHCASTDGTRIALRGVFLNHEKGEAVATNGHTMAIVKNDALKELPKSVIVVEPVIPQLGSMFLICEHEDSWYFGNMNSKLLSNFDCETFKAFRDVQVAKIIDVDYPKYREAVNTVPGETTRRIIINPSVFQQVINLSMSNKKLTLWIDDDRKCVVWKSGQYEGGIMPLRPTYEDDADWPGYVREDATTQTINKGEKDAVTCKCKN